MGLTAPVRPGRYGYGSLRAWGSRRAKRVSCKTSFHSRYHHDTGDPPEGRTSRATPQRALLPRLRCCFSHRPRPSVRKARQDVLSPIDCPSRAPPGTPGTPYGPWPLDANPRKSLARSHRTVLPSRHGTEEAFSPYAGSGSEGLPLFFPGRTGCCSSLGQRCRCSARHDDVPLSPAIC